MSKNLWNEAVDRHIGWVAPMLFAAVATLVLWGMKMREDVAVLRATTTERCAAAKAVVVSLDKRLEDLGTQVVKIAEDGAETKELVIRIDATLKAATDRPKVAMGTRKPATDGGVLCRSGY